MESLALLVATLLAIILFAGPIALVMTSKFLWNLTKAKTWLWITRRVLVSLLSIFGTFLSMTFLVAAVPAAAKIFALFGLFTNGYALKREYLRPLRFSDLFGTRGPGVGSTSGNDGHGPSGQS
jgi:hypothetical protein